jgi:hypothetical protein
MRKEGGQLVQAAVPAHRRRQDHELATQEDEGEESSGQLRVQAELGSQFRLLQVGKKRYSSLR